MSARSAHRPLAVAAALWILATLATTSRADEVTLTPSKDNTIYEEGNNLSNGAGIGLFAGNTAMSRARRALLTFTVAGAIPPGSTVTSAQLVLRVTMSASGTQLVTLHRLTADWGEGTSNAEDEEGKGATAATGDATWRYRFAKTVDWSTRGGDFVAAESASALAPNSGPVTWESTPEMVADVQSWLDAPAGNFGWIVLGDEGHDMTAKRFASRQATNLTTRPMLVVEFQPGGGATPTPSTTSLPTQTTTASPTPPATATTTGTRTATAMATASATRTMTATATAPFTGTATLTALPTETATPTGTATAVPTEPPTVTLTATVTATATEPPSATPTASPLATDTPVSTDTPSPTDTPVPGETAVTATVTATATMASPSPTSTATPPVVACVGDCDSVGGVTINELITGVAIALGNQPLAACPAFDPSGSGSVEINELIAAVSNALNGC